MELSNMSLTELRKLENKVALEIKKRSESERKNLLKQFKKMASEKGLSMEELVDTPADKKTPDTRKPRGKAAAKSPAKKVKKPFLYFHPENASIGWSGHGRRPQWVMDWVEQGKSLDELKKVS